MKKYRFHLRNHEKIIQNSSNFLKTLKFWNRSNSKVKQAFALLRVCLTLSCYNLSYILYKILVSHPKHSEILIYAWFLKIYVSRPFEKVEKRIFPEKSWFFQSGYNFFLDEVWKFCMLFWDRTSVIDPEFFSKKIYQLNNCFQPKRFLIQK